ncbi:MAG: TrbC/VirB2 family protein [Candidatus Peregrinibacteria bacterium]
MSLFIPAALAQDSSSFVVSSWGYGKLNWADILRNVMTMLTGTVEIAAVAVFVVGAFFYTMSGVDQNLNSNGKKAMIGSLVGLGIVLGAQAMIRTAAFFIWG